MAKGFLTFKLAQAQDAVPVEGATIEIYSSGGALLNTAYSDGNGDAGPFSLDAPDGDLSLTPGEMFPYGAYNARITKSGYRGEVINGIKVFDGEHSIQSVNMVPLVNGLSRSADVEIIDIGPTALVEGTKRQPEFPPENRMLREVIIPEYISVHLGRPDNYAKNIRVKFTDYIKNVASSEIYPTWPYEALVANILCQISLALNRLYTEWYPSQGYDFDITNSTAFDQCYIAGGTVFENISQIVDTMFNQYIRRHGRTEPYFAEYCSGSSVTCDGLSQWGSLYLAQSGLNAYEILTRYYPSDIEIAASDKIEDITASYSGNSLQEGSRGVDVQNMQIYLNRIRRNFPFIPEIANPNGYFGEDTEAAVTAFQSIFSLVPDGIIGKATWYKINYIYLAVTKLAELNAEAAESIGQVPPNVVLREGDQGNNVKKLQHILNFIAEFLTQLPILTADGIFGSKTKKAVTDFQLYTGLSPDGIVGKNTWNALYKTYYNFNDSEQIPVPPVTPPSENPSYPGYLIKEGAVGNEVRLMQGYLGAIADYYPSIPKVVADGDFGPQTTAAVKAFQTHFGLSADGIIGPASWNKISEIYHGLGNNGGDAYPGYILAQGSMGEYVSRLQNYLNAITAAYGLFPALSVDSIFGPATENAVKEFQKRFGLVPDGLVGPQTWARIVREYKNIVNNQSTIQSMSRALIGRMFFGRPF